MAYIDQIKKKQIAPTIKAICAKYGVKATLSIDNHSTLKLYIKSGSIDFIKTFNETVSAKPDYTMYADHTKVTYIDVNPYWYQEHFVGPALKFLEEVLEVMNFGNHNRSDIQSDYFDVGWYVGVKIGKWDKPYELVA